MRRLSRADLLIALAFLLAAGLFFGDTLVGGKLLLPADNLYRMQPWRALAPQAGVAVPHNELISDMILQNLAWKRFAGESLRAGAPPLWNPYTFGGVPFLAAGQYGVLYPLGAIFYLIPPERAYGWFTALHAFLGALFAYAFLRVIAGGGGQGDGAARGSRVGGAIAGLAFGFSGFVVVSVLWPMVVSTLIWIPLLLTFVELIVRSQETGRTYRAGLLVALGGVAVGLQFLAGHLEMSFYALFTMLFYVVARLLFCLKETRRLGPTIRAGLLLAAMVAVGGAVAAAQLLPFYELIGQNYRTGWSTYEEVVGYALPKKQALGLLVPDLYGNPTHHTYFDVFEGRERPVENSARSQPTDPPHTIFWGVKNYVEATGYVGILPLVLALVAVLVVRDRYTLIFAAYAAFSLLLVLGTPLYALIYFGIPGVEQLHTPFRWLLPYSLSVAVLAGLGASWLVRLPRAVPAVGAVPRPGFLWFGWLLRAGPPSQSSQRMAVIPTYTKEGEGAISAPPRLAKERGRRLARLVGLGALLAGLLVLGGLAVSRALPDRAVALADAFLRRDPAAAGAFADGRMLYSYEARNLLLFGALLAASGGVVLLASGARGRAWPGLAVLLLAADLFVFGAGFNSRSDPRWLELRPPAVEFLAADRGMFRIVSFGDEDVLKPVTGMLYGLQDVRGYDTVIPRQYVEYWGLIEPPQGLPYSMIHKLVRPSSLSSRYLDLLNVKYVLTTATLAEPGLRLVYDGEVRIYERVTALPRAFLVSRARLVSDGAALAALREPAFDPRREVVLEAPGQIQGQARDQLQLATQGATGSEGEARIERYEPSKVSIVTRSDEPAYLVLADSYFPGWRAEVDGQPTVLYRANHNFRAVQVPAGEHVVAFKYSPDSFMLGLFVSFVGLAVAALLVTVHVWRRLTSRGGEASTAQRIGRNSLAPLATSLGNRVVDFAFAMLMLRLLGAENVGKFAVAVVFVGYLDILTNFGLNALLIREVAREPAARHRYLTGSLLLRLGLWLAAAPLALLGLYFSRDALGLGPDTLLVVAILTVSLVPGNVSAALSSLFYAFEKIEYPSALTIATNLLRIVLQAAALLAGFGILGLAAISLLVSLVTAVAFAVLAFRVLGRPRLELQPGLLRRMLIESYPLMINHLLATVFFKIDSLMLQGRWGSTVVGYYSAAYKFVDGLQVIPSSFTFAIFPVISRRAGDGPKAVLRAHVAGLRILVGLAVPISISTTALAEPLILLLGGREYLPDAAIALSVLIWFLPFGFFNGLTQYVLIAINQQRFITLSFVVATSFNVLANLYAIPRYSYVGAAVVTIFSELALAAPFYYCVRRHLGPLPLFSLFGRTGLAGAGMVAVVWLGRELSPLATVPVALLLYPALLVATGAVSREEARWGWKLARARLGRRQGGQTGEDDGPRGHVPSSRERSSSDTTSPRL